MLTIKSSNRKIAKSLKTLFHDVLKVDENVGTWSNQLKERDNLYFNLKIKNKIGVVGVRKPESYEVMHFRLLPDLKQRTDKNVRRAILCELNKVALIHLYVQGFNSEQMTNFDLNFS